MNLIRTQRRTAFTLIELEVISACVLGGVSFTGGVGTMSFLSGWRGWQSDLRRGPVVINI